MSNDIECIPTKYLKHIEGTDGLYEMRITLGSDIFRVFCFFDKGRLVVLLSGFQKKTQKTPKKEIDKAVRLMAQYYDDITTLDQFKDEIYGVKGTPRRDNLERELETLRIGVQIRNARQKKEMTQAQLAERINKKRTFISKVENDGGNLTLKTLIDIVERGLGGKLNIEVKI